MGRYAYSLIICASNKDVLLTSPKTSELIARNLRESSTKHNFDVYAYCIMPDHLHLLVRGKEEHSNLRHFVSEFKQKTGFQFKQISNKTLWQRSYYDHVLRKEEDLLSIAKYIFHNPVRKGLVEDYKGYPCLGSFVFETKNMSEP